MAKAKKRKNGHGGARKGSGRKKKPTTVHNYAELGDAPHDPLEAAEWAFRANAVTMREVMMDPGMSAKERRSEIRTISRTMNMLMPKARLRQAEKLLRGDASKLKASKAGPTLTAAPPPPAEDMAPERTAVNATPRGHGAEEDAA